MKLLIINPNGDPNTTRILRQKAEEYAEGVFQIETIGLEGAPLKISCQEDQINVAKKMVQILRNEEQTYDAFIIACHADPNLSVMKEITSKPVIGIAEASMCMAARMGNGFAVITPNARYVSNKYAMARHYNCDNLLRAVVPAEGDSKEALLEAAKKALDAGCVDCIVLGCANYALADRYIEQHLKNTPILEGVACAIMLAAGLAQYRKYKRHVEKN